MSIQWEKIRQSANSTPQFQEELRATLYENAVLEHQARFERTVKKIEKPMSSLELSFQKKTSALQNFSDVVSGFAEFFHGIRRWAVLLGGGALAMILVVPMLSVFVSAPLSASTKSYIANFSGTGEIIRNSDHISPVADQEIFEQDILATNRDSGAEILFFEGTSLRLDKNTRIKIHDLSPEKGAFSAGGVQVELIEGRIWVQNFHSPTTQSALEIITPNMEVFPIRSGLDIEYQGGKEHIRVFENSALIHAEGLSLESEVLLSAHQELFFTPFDTDIDILSLTPKSSLWVIKNENRSSQYKREYIQQISDKMKEKFVINEITSQIHTFIAQDPSPEEMEKMIQKMNLLMNASDEKFESDSPSNSLNELLTESVENKKNSDSNFDETLVIKKPVVLKKQMVKQMVKPHSSTRLPVIQKKEISKTRAIKNSSLIPVLPAESEKTHEVLLAEKISPLVEKEEITPAKEVKTAKQILEEKRIEKFHKASQNFSDQVNTLSFRDSRRHHAQNILHKIPNTPENIELLDIMMKDAPVDVQRYIQAKKMKILRNTGEK